jgi:Ran GTPase-activating protein (RanGAP) involved in mRNA processing and transport
LRNFDYFWIIFKKHKSSFVDTANMIGEEGAKMIAHHLALSSCTLVHLDLSLNFLCHSGSKIATSLLTNKSLKTLNLSGKVTGKQHSITSKPPLFL